MEVPFAFTPNSTIIMIIFCIFIHLNIIDVMVHYIAHYQYQVILLVAYLSLNGINDHEINVTHLIITSKQNINHWDNQFKLYYPTYQNQDPNNNNQNTNNTVNNSTPQNNPNQNNNPNRNQNQNQSIQQNQNQNNNNNIQQQQQQVQQQENVNNQNNPNQMVQQTQTPQPNVNKTDQQKEDETNLIINYLPPTMSEGTLATLFSPYGLLERCKIVVDLQTLRSRGYGFVKYDNAI